MKLADSPFAEQHPLVGVQLATPEGYKLMIAEMLQGVTAEPAGPFQEWPQNVQDAIFFALERLNEKAKHTGGPYQLLTAEAGTEPEGDAYIKMVAYRYVPKVSS